MNMAAQIDEHHPLHAYQGATAKDRLRNILTTRTIYPSPMPFVLNHPQAVCFSECVWEGLTELANSYSTYGIVFSKRLVFQAGGGPALYMRGNILNGVQPQIPAEVLPFVSPFDPEAVIRPGIPLDWLHEREWRLPSAFTFEYADIEFVIVNTIDDAREIVYQLGAERLPEDKLIPLEVYRNIKVAWGPR